MLYFYVAIIDLYTKQETEYEDKNNNTKCIIYTHRRSDRPIRNMKILCTDSLGNILVLKL